MSYRTPQYDKMTYGYQYCDGTQDIAKYVFMSFDSTHFLTPRFLTYQHVPPCYNKMNEFLPHHLHYANMTTPFNMQHIPASLLLNRVVMKCKVHFSRDNQTGIPHPLIGSAKACVWRPKSDYVVSSWTNGKIVRMNAVNYGEGKQQQQDVEYFYFA